MKKIVIFTGIITFISTAALAEYKKVPSVAENQLAILQSINTGQQSVISSMQELSGVSKQNMTNLQGIQTSTSATVREVTNLKQYIDQTNRLLNQLIQKQDEIIKALDKSGNTQPQP